MLEGNLLVRLTSTPPVFNMNRIEIWDWAGINIRKESQGIHRDKQSIQYHAIQKLVSSPKYCVVFDDDNSGEIADIVSILDESNKIVDHHKHPFLKWVNTLDFAPIQAIHHLCRGHLIRLLINLLPIVFRNRTRHRHR